MRIRQQAPVTKLWSLCQVDPFLSAGGAIQEGDDLGAGAGPAGAKQAAAHASGDALLRRPLNGPLVVGVCGNVREALLLGLLYKSALDGDDLFHRLIVGRCRGADLELEVAGGAADGQCTTGDRASGGVRPCDLIGRGTGSVEFLAQIYSGTDPCGEIIAGDGLFGLLDLKVDRSGVQLQLEVAASGQRAEFDEVAEP